MDEFNKLMYDVVIHGLGVIESMTDEQLQEALDGTYDN
jgi:hypothetical protein